MRRFIVSLLSVASTLSMASGTLNAQQVDSPKLRTLAVPAASARSLATKLSIRYRDIPGVQISADAPNQRLVVMAPEQTQREIATDLQGMMQGNIQQVAARQSGPLSIGLTHITWREFEDDLQQLVGQKLPVTTSRNGERAAFQLTAAPLQNTTIEVDRRDNKVTVIAPEPALPGWQKMISTLDQTPLGPGQITEIMRLENAEPAPIQRALRLLRELENSNSEAFAAATVGAVPFRNAMFQQEVGGGNQGQDVDAGPGPGEETGAGPLGDVQIQFVPELGTIIVKGTQRDVQRVMDVIKEIELKAAQTAPEVQVQKLNHADSNAVAELLQQLYDDVLSARQGDVSITALDSPNALLLIGRKEAIAALQELITKIDQPVDESSRMRVFRLQNASAVDAEQTIRDFFTLRPGVDDELRPGLGFRVRVLADYRTNSLIISASPRDMIEITRLINELDVQEIASQNEIKVFTLNNAIAEDLAPVIQTAINGQGDAEGNDNLTPPATTLSILAVDAENKSTIDSGVLAGAIVTADTGANSIVVRAPAASMPLIAELIRQLDKAPGIDSLVKVFTIQNGDATQLTSALQTLFGDDAGTTGTSIGAGNLAGLPSATGATESSLVPLRFSTDIRTNSIIASGSAEDLEVVESILLRLDSDGFAERITEVIWLRHQPAANVAAAIQDYVSQRSTLVNQIQQFQQGGLGPFDLPDRDLIVAAEAQTNSILLSVSPRIYEEVRRMIDKLDRRPPMVLIKTLIAEVTLDDTFEIGGEFGLQDSLLYDRGIAAGAFPGAGAASAPGFGFNNSGTPNVNSFGQESLAGRTVSTFGLGTSNSTLGYGGFVLSAASESVSLLLRTLQDANRLQILSRPQIMTMDNTEGYIQVGRLIARVDTIINNGLAGTQVTPEDLEVGLIMQIQPRVGADGLIVMTIDATRSDRDAANGTLIPTGGGQTVFINDILQTTAQSTIAAYSGQTVIFGGLIQKTRSNFSRRVPIVSEIPLLGTMFKYDQEFERRSELLVIMTPMLVSSDEDMEYVKMTESSRMSWCLADVVEAHGDVGLSGGYGLWGPATGATIYPDLQPTIDEVIIDHPYHSSDAPVGAGVITEPTIPAADPTLAPTPAESESDLIAPQSGIVPAPVRDSFTRQASATLPVENGQNSSAGFSMPTPVTTQPDNLFTPTPNAQFQMPSGTGAVPESQRSTSTGSVMGAPVTQPPNWMDLTSGDQTSKDDTRPQPTRLGLGQ